MNEENKQNPQAVWLIIGIGVGVAVGVAMGNIAVGIGVGVAIGAALSITQGKEKDQNTE